MKRAIDAFVSFVTPLLSGVAFVVNIVLDFCALVALGLGMGEGNLSAALAVGYFAAALATVLYALLALPELSMTYRRTWELGWSARRMLESWESVWQLVLRSPGIRGVAAAAIAVWSRDRARSGQAKKGRQTQI